MSLIENIGGLEASLKALDVLRQHKMCCEYWSMIDYYGKGRARWVVKERKLEAVLEHHPHKFTLNELERAVEEELKKHLTTIGEAFKVVYNEPTVLPRRLFGASSSSYWESSPKLLIRYHHRGEDHFVTGCYHFKTYEGGVDEFRLDGHNGDWSKYVTGWAYV